MAKSNERRAKPDGNAGAKSSKCVAITVLKMKRRYSMYDPVEVDADGAFLGGKLLLEPGETITLELAFDNDETTELEAHVVSADTGERPGIRVMWKALSAADRARLSNQ